jgi:molybdopterin/thiamine biosynthesis adenylyltransferase
MLDPANHPALRPWFRAHPDRFKEEREKLEAMGFVLDEEKLKDASTVVFIGSLSEFPDRKLIVTFPWAYPSIPPKITDDGNCQLLPRHQRASTRTYCLFGPSSESWFSKMYATDALAETSRLLGDVLGEPANSLDDPYPEPPSAQPIFSKDGVILVPPPVSDFLPNDRTKPAEGIIRLKYSSKEKNGSTSRGVILEAGFKDKAEKAFALKGYAFVDGTDIRGRLTFLPNLPRPIVDGRDFVANLESFGIAPQKNYDWHALVFPEESGDRSTTRYSWLLFKKEKAGFCAVRTLTYRSAEKSARIPGLEFLPKKRIAVIGCGSIGSKIACSLASSGVKDFLLVDKDLMEPVNAVRHECGIHDFARPKVHALAIRLASLNPDTWETCDAITGDPFGELPSEIREKFFAYLDKCDLIVNATGVQGLSRAICELSNHFFVPSIHVSVTNGAWSGEVFRYLPGKSSSWQCFQEAFEEPPPGQQAPLGHVFGPGCNQPTFTGTSYELDIVAGLATSFLIDTLLVADGGESEYDGDYLLWEGRDPTGKLLQRTTVSAVPAQKTCVDRGEAS